MTDHTNPAASMHITMEDNTTPQNADRLFKAITATMQTFINFEVQEAIMARVDMLVEAKFNAMLEARNALQLMDDALEQRITDKIAQAIIDHEGTEEHHDHANIEQIAADQARETLKEYARTQEGWVTEDNVKDIITEHVDEEIDRIDWEERVKDVLREML